MKKHLQIKHKLLLSSKFGSSQPIKGQRTEAQSANTKPSTSKSANTIDIFVKPRPIATETMGDHGCGLEPSSEEMDLDGDNITILKINANCIKRFTISFRMAEIGLVMILFQLNLGKKNI